MRHTCPRRHFPRPARDMASPRHRPAPKPASGTPASTVPSNQQRARVKDPMTADVCKRGPALGRMRNALPTYGVRPRWCHACRPRLLRRQGGKTAGGCDVGTGSENVHRIHDVGRPFWLRPFDRVPQRACGNRRGRRCGRHARRLGLPTLAHSPCVSAETKPRRGAAPPWPQTRLGIVNLTIHHVCGRRIALPWMVTWAAKVDAAFPLSLRFRTQQATRSTSRPISAPKKAPRRAKLPGRH